MNKPKILVWDLETGFNKAAIFSLFSKWTPPSNILQERYIICGGYKELDSDKTHCISVIDDITRFGNDPADDKYVVEKLHAVLSSADVLIAHYGDSYDIKYFNTRALFHGLPPLPNVITIDTLKIAKNKFMFNSKKLDYLGQFLGCGKKIETNNQLWHDCLNGDVGAVQKMNEYNIQDVDLLEEVYKKLAPYAPAKMNYNIFNRDACPSCGSININKKGFVFTRVNKYQGYLCKSCGHRFRSGAIIKEHTSPALR
jgi:hypothetical protein